LYDEESRNNSKGAPRVVFTVELVVTNWRLAVGVGRV